MKNFFKNTSTFSLCIILFLLVISACQKTETGQEVTSQEASSYTCTMHPEVKKDQPGKCPKCGMDLVKSDK